MTTVRLYRIDRRNSLCRLRKYQTFDGNSEVICAVEIETICMPITPQFSNKVSETCVALNGIFKKSCFLYFL